MRGWGQRGAGVGLQVWSAPALVPQPRTLQNRNVSALGVVGGVHTHTGTHLAGSQHRFVLPSRTATTSGASGRPGRQTWEGTLEGGCTSPLLERGSGQSLESAVAATCCVLSAAIPAISQSPSPSAPRGLSPPPAPLSSPLHLAHTLARLDTLPPGSQCQVTGWHSTTGRHDPPAALVEATARIHAHPGLDACCAPGEGPSRETCSAPPLAPGTARRVQGESGTLQPHPLGGNTGPHASVPPPQHPATPFCPVLHTVRTPTPTSPPLGPGSC